MFLISILLLKIYSITLFIFHAKLYLLLLYNPTHQQYTRHKRTSAFTHNHQTFASECAFDCDYKTFAFELEYVHRNRHSYLRSNKVAHSHSKHACKLGQARRNPLRPQVKEPPFNWEHQDTATGPTWYLISQNCHNVDHFGAGRYHNLLLPLGWLAPIYSMQMFYIFSEQLC